MTFVIDTGPSHASYSLGSIDYTQAMLDAAHDAAPANATQEEIDAALAKLIVIDLTAPRTAKTARAHLLRYWPLIAPMAHTAPASFDWILTEFAERLAELQ